MKKRKMLRLTIESKYRVGDRVRVPGRKGLGTIVNIEWYLDGDADGSWFSGPHYEIAFPAKDGVGYSPKRAHTGEDTISREMEYYGEPDPTGEPPLRNYTPRRLPSRGRPEWSSPLSLDSW